MIFLRIFPAFNQILDAAKRLGVYEVLMYAFFIFTIVSCIYWTTKIGANGVGLFWLQPTPWMVVGFGLAALFVYIALFSDLSLRALAGGTGTYYMTSSPVLFALVYCLFFPFCIGGTLGLGIKSAIALTKKESPGGEE